MKQRHTRSRDERLLGKRLRFHIAAAGGVGMCHRMIWKNADEMIRGISSLVNTDRLYVWQGSQFRHPRDVFD